MGEIKIWEPRYNDRRLLVARYRIPAGQNIKVRILKGAYKGLYEISNRVIADSPVEKLKTKNDNRIEVRAISLDKIERIKEEEK